MHMDINNFVASIYVATQYDSGENSMEGSPSNIAVITLDDSTLPHNIIECLPLVIIDLLKQMGYSE